MPQGTDAQSPDLPSSHPPTIAPDYVTGKVTGHASSPPSPLPLPWLLGRPLRLPIWGRKHSSLFPSPSLAPPCGIRTLRVWYSAGQRCEMGWASRNWIRLI